MPSSDTNGSVTTSGQLSGFVTRGGNGDGGQPVRVEPWNPNGPPVLVRKPSRWWRIKNGLRKIVQGDAFIPLLVKAVKLCRSKWVRRAPVLGPMLAGSVGALGIVVGELRAFVTHADGSVTDYGVIGNHVVLTAGKNYLASSFPNTTEPENLKYHAFGTGTNAAVVGDTALQTELTTQYAADNTRPTGSQSSLNNTYTTAGTLSPDASVAITEWGLASQAANSGGTFLDRQVFSAINLTNVDSMTVTYTFTIS